MIKDLNESQKKLADFMSELSEKAFNASWIEGLELSLWKAMNRDLLKFGRLTFNEETINELKRLSQEVNGWIIFDEQTEETFISFEQWKKMNSKN